MTFGDGIKNMWLTITSDRKIELLKTKSGWCVQKEDAGGTVNVIECKSIAEAQSLYDQLVGDVQ